MYLGCNFDVGKKTIPWKNPGFRLNELRIQVALGRWQHLSCLGWVSTGFLGDVNFAHEGDDVAGKSTSNFHMVFIVGNKTKRGFFIWRFVGLPENWSSRKHVNVNGCQCPTMIWYMHDFFAYICSKDWTYPSLPQQLLSFQVYQHFQGRIIHFLSGYHISTLPTL